MHTLFSSVSTPARLPAIPIPQEKIDPIRHYFLAIELDAEQESWKRNDAEHIFSCLNREDPIKAILDDPAYQHRIRMNYETLFTDALEMLYAARHEAESEWLKSQEMQKEEEK